MRVQYHDIVPSVCKLSVQNLVSPTIIVKGPLFLGYSVIRMPRIISTSTHFKHASQMMQKTKLKHVKSSTNDCVLTIKVSVSEERAYKNLRMRSRKYHHEMRRYAVTKDSVVMKAEAGSCPKVIWVRRNQNVTMILNFEEKYSHPYENAIYVTYRAIIGDI